jgi:hypothetical protein
VVDRSAVPVLAGTEQAPRLITATTARIVLIIAHLLSRRVMVPTPKACDGLNAKQARSGRSAPVVAAIRV